MSPPSELHGVNLSWHSVYMETTHMTDARWRQRRVLAVLEAGPAKVAEIAADAPFSATSVRRALHGLERRGEARRVGTRWRLVDTKGEPW